MGIKALKTLDGYLNYETSGNGTLMQSYQELIESEHETLKNIVDNGLWQPNTNYVAGNIVQSPSMMPNTVAKVKSAGVSGAQEPTWTELGTTVIDNGVTYLIIQKTIEMATIDDIEAGTDIVLAVTPKALADFMKNVYENAKDAPGGIATLDANKVLIQKAKYDAAGNVITEVYATKTGLTQAIGGIAVFSGATDTTTSNKGLVPVAAAGDQKKFLRGDGIWSTVESGLTKVVYTAPGTYTWTCPVGVTSVLATIIGAGGGGTGGTYLGNGTTGGGGNILNNVFIPVTAGQGYSVVVGTGGTGSSPTTGDGQFVNAAGDGGQSSFNNIVSLGGQGGYNRSSDHGNVCGNGSLTYDYVTYLNPGNGTRGGGQFGGLTSTVANIAGGDGGVGCGGGGGYGYQYDASRRSHGGNGGPGMVVLVY